MAKTHCKVCGCTYVSRAKYELHKCVTEAKTMTEAELLQKIKEMEKK